MHVKGTYCHVLCTLSASVDSDIFSRIGWSHKQNSFVLVSLGIYKVLWEDQQTWKYFLSGKWNMVRFPIMDHRYNDVIKFLTWLWIWSLKFTLSFLLISLKLTFFTKVENLMVRIILKSTTNFCNCLCTSGPVMQEQSCHQDTWNLGYPK